MTSNVQIIDTLHGPDGKGYQIAIEYDWEKDSPTISVIDPDQDGKIDLSPSNSELVYAAYKHFLATMNRCVIKEVWS